MSLDHVTHGLIEGVHLQRLEVTDDGANVVEDLLNERHHFQALDLHNIMFLRGTQRER